MSNYIKTKNVVFTSESIILTKGDWKALPKEQQDMYEKTHLFPNCAIVDGALYHLNNEEREEFNKNRH